MLRIPLRHSRRVRRANVKVITRKVRRVEEDPECDERVVVDLGDEGRSRKWLMCHSILEPPVGRVQRSVLTACGVCPQQHHVAELTLLREQLFCRTHVRRRSSGSWRCAPRQGDCKANKKSTAPRLGKSHPSLSRLIPTAPIGGSRNNPECGERQRIIVTVQHRRTTLTLHRTTRETPLDFRPPDKLRHVCLISKRDGLVFVEDARARVARVRAVAEPS
eukprot:1485433-Prymnesium_polylepis.1